MSYCTLKLHQPWAESQFTRSSSKSRGVRSGSFNISTRVDKREQVSTIFVNISINEAVVFTSMFQLLVVLALLGRILDADWSENDVPTRRVEFCLLYYGIEGRH